MKETRKLSRHRFRFLLLAAALLCWWHAMLLSAELPHSAGSLSLRYGTGGIPFHDAQRMLEQENVSLAAWLQKDDTLIEERTFARSAPVRLLEVAGDTDLIIPAGDMLAGFLPARGESSTLAIDAATAYALWGAMDVTGEPLLYDGREYTVTGVFVRPERTALLQAGQNVDTVFPCLELSGFGAEAPPRSAELLISRYALPEPDILRDNAELSAILRQTMLLPAICALLLLLHHGLRLAVGTPASFWGKLLFAAVLLTGTLCAALPLGFHPVIPATFIPTRWSDFSFWSRLLETLSKQAELNRALSWAVPDFVRWEARRFLLLLGGASFAGVACLRRLLR